MTTATLEAPKTSKKPQPESAPAAAPGVPASDRALAKIAAAKKEFAKSFVERDAELNLTLVAMVAGENILFVGPPGTAKSMLCDAIHELVGGEGFSCLMNKFTAPEELFGPADLKALDAGEYLRKVEGYLPTATTAFLDEIFKAGPGILNTTLKILNEGTFKNGRQTLKCPLKFTLAASNEYPGGDNASEMTALFDRFVIRKTVRPVSSTKGRDRLLYDDLTRGPVTPLTADELQAARDAARALPYTDEAKEVLKKVLRDLANAGVIIGDRRVRKAVGVARAAAWLEGAAEVGPEHLTVLQHVLWDEPLEQPKKATEIIMKAANPDGAVVAEKLLAAEAIMEKVKMTDTESLIKTSKELNAIIKDLKKVNTAAGKEATRRVEAELNKVLRASVDATE